MQEVTRGRPISVATILMFAGGGLLAVGSLIRWARVSGGGLGLSAKGTDIPEGWITLGAGLIVLAVGTASLWLRGGRMRGVLAILAIDVALIGGGVGLYDA